MTPLPAKIRVKTNSFPANGYWYNLGLFVVLIIILIMAIWRVLRKLCPDRIHIIPDRIPAHAFDQRALL